MNVDYVRRLTRRKFLRLMLMAGATAAVDWNSIDALAVKVKDKRDYPIVVIGAGLGGLVSAAYLAKHGFPVTLLEQHDLPGGYATSFSRASGKFNFEVSLHATVAENGMSQRILSELGVWDELNVVYTPEFCRVISPDYDLDLPACDPKGVKSLLIKTFPDEEKGIEAFIEDMLQAHKFSRYGYTSKNSIINRLEKITLADWLSMHINKPEVKAILSNFWGYYGLPPSKLNALFYAVATGEYLVSGGQYYKFRSQDLSYTLMDAIEKKGGQVLLETEAKRIWLKERAVASVEETGGKRYPCKAVLANASVPTIFSKLIPSEEVPTHYLRKLGRYQISLSSFIVWLGLNQEIRNKINSYEITVSETHDAEKIYQASLTGDYNKAHMNITIYDNLFKGYSKPGTSTLSITSLCGYEPWKRFELDYMEGRKKAYNKEKERWAQTFIKRAEERVIPKLNSFIEVMDAATPLTNIRFTKNTHGSIYGFDRLGEMLEARTPIKGLYLCSAWNGGGGYAATMIAGRQAVMSLMQDWKKEG